MKNNKLKDLLVLFLFVIIPNLVGYLGSFTTIPKIDTWYASLNAPVFSPPPAIFAPVWIILYTLMGIATFLVWKKFIENKDQYIKVSLLLFFVHLMFNAAWTPIFFGMENLLLGLVDIALVLVLAAFTAVRYFKTSKTAGYMLIPYLLWVSFATVLNLSYVLLN